MKIAFYCPNKNIEHINFNQPHLGNPGCGATEYLQVAIPYMLDFYYGNSFRTIIIADSIKNLPNSIECLHVSNGLNEAIIKASKEKVDIFVFKSSEKGEEKVFNLLKKYKLNSIVIGQLNPYPECIKLLSECDYIKAFVCVGLNQYDQLIDTKLSSKLFQINNPISDNLINSPECSRNFKYRKDLVYMGALYPQKNFYYLAKNWKKINKFIPKAKLHVIGSADTYGKNSKLGKYGLADPEYEELFMNEINKDKTSAKNVIFHGNLKQSKYEFFSNCRVGIVNPLGNTETCCVSAVEMQAFGLPVCTGNYQALKTTVLNNRSGLLSNNQYQFRRNIFDVYTKEKLFSKLSSGAILNAKLNFSFSQIIHRWYYLFYKIYSNQEIYISNQPSIISRKFSFIYFLRLLNKYLLKGLLRMRSGSIIVLSYYLKDLKIFLFKKFRK